MKKCYETLLPIILCMTSVVAFGQATVTGKVTSAGGGEALPGVNILVKGTSLGTVTDVAGQYTITTPDENSILVFSFIGYATQEVSVGGRSVIDVQIASDVTTLSEVVVVGYGTQLKK